MFKFAPKLSKHTIRFTVVSIFILATVITAIIAISLQYHFSKNMATESASQLFSLSSQKTQLHLEALDQRAQNITRMFAKFGDLVEGNKVNDSAFPVFAEMLKSSKDFYAVYIGFANGDFHELINLDASPAIRAQIDAAFTDRWVTVTVSGDEDKKKRTFSYINDDFTVRAVRTEASDYDASTRPWYVNAKLGEVYKTAPYMFQHLQAPGQTYSAKIPDTNAVLAVDIALSSLDQYLTAQGLSQSGSTDKEVYLFQKSGEIISSNQVDNEHTLNEKITKLTLSKEQKQLVANTPTLMVSNETNWAPIDFSVSGQPRGYSIEVLSLIAQMSGLTFEYTNGFTWPELVKGFEEQSIDMLQPIYNTEENRQKGILSKAFINLPFAIITQPNTVKITKLTQLQDKTLAIAEGWSVTQSLKEHFPSIKIIEHGYVLFSG